MKTHQAKPFLHSKVNTHNFRSLKQLTIIYNLLQNLLPIHSRFVFFQAHVTLIQEPQSIQHVVVGQSDVMISCRAKCILSPLSCAVTYQWYFKSTLLEDEDKHVLFLIIDSQAKQGFYHCVVQCGCPMKDSVSSKQAFISVGN